MSTEVLYKNDFSQGLGGITGLIESGNGMDRWPQLSQEGVVSPYAMLLDTQPGAAQATAVIRLGLYKARLRSTYIVGWTDPGTVENNSLVALRFFIDTQDGSLGSTVGRHWHEVRHEHYNQTDAGVTNKWQLQKGSTSSLSYNDTDLTYELGYNQRYKANARKIVIDWDLVNHKGLFLRVGTEGVSLRGLAGPTAEAKLQGSGTFFDNSMNFGITVEPRSNNASARVQAFIHYWKIEVL